jgi:hypothetical protein
MEHCKNPWKDTCKSENIKLYIQVKGENLPICQMRRQIADQETGKKGKTQLQQRTIIH